MKNLQKLIDYIFVFYENYFDEIMFALDLFVIMFPVRIEIKMMILFVKYLKKKTD